MNLKRKTDGELLAEFARTRAEPAFAELVCRHGSMVHGTCLRVARSPELAEEAAQAAFLVLARKAGKLAGRADAGGWLHGVAGNVARWMKRSDVRRRALEREAVAMRRRQSASGDFAPQSDAALAERLDAELDRLPEAQRQVVVGLHLEGRTQAELAEALGVPEGTVAWRAKVALEKLRGRLTRRGVALGAAALGPAIAGLASAGVEAGVGAGLVSAAGLPASLASLPSLAAAFAANGAAGTAGLVGAVGAQHAAPLQVAEGVLRAMFWTKMKVLAAVAVVGLAAPALVYCMAGSENKFENGKGAPPAGSFAGVRAGGPAERPASFVADARTEFGETVDGLAVALRVEPSEWKHGSFAEKPPTLAVVLKNTTGAKMLVYDGESVGHRQPVPWRLSIVDQRGRRWQAFGVLKQIMVKVEPTSDDFIVLAPGEEKVLTLTLASFLPPEGYFSGMKEATPSDDERIPELPAGEYTLTYRYSGAVTDLWGHRAGESDAAEAEVIGEVVRERTAKLRALARGLGCDDFWTGEAASGTGKVRVTAAPGAGLSKPANPTPAVF